LTLSRVALGPFAERRDAATEVARIRCCIRFQLTEFADQANAGTQFALATTWSIFDFHQKERVNETTG
jgi:hypothetical protein